MANPKTRKKVIRRRREKSHVEQCQVLIRSSFPITMLTVAARQGIARYFAYCEHCGWTRPVSGLVTEPIARSYTDEHNTETHGGER